MRIVGGKELEKNMEDSVAEKTPETSHELDVEMLYAILYGELGYRDFLSWSDLADEVGVHRSTFTRMKHGKKPSVDVFLSVCMWLGVNPAGFAVETMERVDA